MKLTFTIIIFFLPFITPIVFQIIMGARNIKNKTTLKIWQTAVLSIVIMCIGVAFLDILMMRPATARTHDGLAYVGLIALMIITCSAILITMGIQFFMKNKKQPIG